MANTGACKAHIASSILARRSIAIRRDKKYMEKYNKTRMFWMAHSPSERLEYLMDWKIYRVRGIHSQCPRCDWEDLTDIEKSVIWKAHKTAVESDE